MNVSGPIRALINANGTANGLLAGRVYPVIFPEQYNLPAVAVNIVGVTPNPTKSGASDVDTVLLQVDCYASTYAAAQDVSTAVRGAIDYYRGDVVVGVETFGIDYIDYEGQTDAWEEKPKEYRVSCDYSVRVSRSGGITDMPSFVGLTAYDNDGDALNGGVEYNEFYLLSQDNDYGLPYGVIKQVVLNPGTLGIYASDAAAITGGLASGDYYVLSAANIYGLPTGTIKQIA